MAPSQLQLLTKLPLWHVATQPLFPPLVFKIPFSLLAQQTWAADTDTVEGLLQIDKINDVHVDPELYSSITIPGAEWEVRRTSMIGSGESGLYYFVFSPPFTSKKVSFELNANRRITYRLRCDIFLVPDGMSAGAEGRCMRYVKKTLLDQCWFEVVIAPFNPFGRMRHWDAEIQTEAEKLAEEVHSQTGVTLKTSTCNWEVRRTASRERLWRQYYSGTS